MTRYVSKDLRRLPVFATLSRRALARVDSLVTPVTFHDGDVLCHEGFVGREAFIIVSGEVEVSRGATHLATIGAGGIVGEAALLGAGRRNATVTAAGEVTALVMSVQEFVSLLSVDEVGDEVRRMAATRTPQPVAA